MSIWTRCAARADGGDGPFRRLDQVVWRVVEGQHVVATRKLVDSDAEQRLLEELIEGAKPPLPDFETEAEAGETPSPRPRRRRDLHYLLTTPFRYPPLRHGSRFGTRAERGIWYGSRELSTSFAETAYYRFFFLAGTEADLGPVEMDLSAFRVPLGTDRGVDLTRGCFGEHRDEISSPVAYAAPQRLGRDMRDAGAQVFLYRSARDADGGINVGVFTPHAFARRKPSRLEAWYSITTPESVEISRRDALRHPAAPAADADSYRFPRRQFEIDGRLPAPAA